MTAPRQPSREYENPLATRYASQAMRENFSDDKKFRTWRKLWIALAQAEHDLGLPIRAEQLDELREHEGDFDMDLVRAKESELRHDVMAHVHAWGTVCPKARAIVHLGATSCFVGDNTDLIVLRDGLRLVRAQVVSLIASLRAFAMQWRELPTLGFTHLQPAQATTVGKRACLWLQDLVHDLEDLDHAEASIRFRGAKGTTGTQASFLELFEGDHEKVRELDRRLTRAMGFEESFAVTGQTYPRKLDFRVCQVLSSLAQSAQKFAGDLRLLAHRREIEEPFESKQFGSSAMPWKRNPMRCERICSLARFVICELDNTAHTAANQWLERTLDDSANRRLLLAESFLATDAVLNLYLDVASGLVVHPQLIEANLAEELPFLASEHLMMEAVKAGADRQDVHEVIRAACIGAAQDREEGRGNTIAARLAAEPSLNALAGRLDQILDGRLYVGRAPEQVLEFVQGVVDPLLERHADQVRVQGEVRV
jgi:adenylosuccinate lyase